MRLVVILSLLLAEMGEERSDNFGVKFQERIFFSARINFSLMRDSRIFGFCRY